MDGLGILTHGDNHFIVRGRKPTVDEARRLTRYWSLIRIGGTTPPDLSEWRISTREYREDLGWALVVGPGEVSGAVKVLLDEMRARGIEVTTVQDC